MWARVVEAMLACWLAASPLIFCRAGPPASLWMLDLGAAALVSTFALASLWQPLRFAHFGILAIALVLIAFGWMSDSPGPADQNHILVGLLLLMFAILPNQAIAPSQDWQRFNKANLSSETQIT